MTARALTLLALTLTSASLLACLGIGRDPEGTNAGECSDAADNDQDDLWDCEDPDCDGSPDCQTPETEAGLCHDGVDNDDDGLLDCYDGDCEGSADCPECWDYPYDDLADDLLQAVCDKMGSCDLFTEYFTYKDCLALGDEPDDGWECQAYDCAAGEACVEAYETVSCNDFIDGYGLGVCEQICSND